MKFVQDSPSQATSQPPTNKCKKLDDVDIAIIQSLKGIKASMKQAVKEDEDDLFSHQIAATLHHLSNRQKTMCKLQVQVLVNIEFPDEHSQQNYHNNSYEQSFNY